MFVPQGDSIIYAEWHFCCWYFDSLNVFLSCAPRFHSTVETIKCKLWLKVHSGKSGTKQTSWCTCVSDSWRRESVSRTRQTSIMNSKSGSATCEVKKPHRASLSQKYNPGNGRKTPYKSCNYAFLSTNTSLLPEDNMGNTRQWIFCLV